MMTRLIGYTLLGVLAVGLIATPVQAVIIVDSWTIDVSGIDGIAAGTSLSGIHKLTYFGYNHATLLDTNGNGIPNTGERATVNGLLEVTDIRNKSGASIRPTTYAAGDSGGTWLLSFEFSVGAVYTDNFGNFTHEDPALGPSVPGAEYVYTAGDNWGELHLIVDGPTDNLGGAPTDPTSGSTANAKYFTDGVEIATFIILPGIGGSFDLNVLDGSDDAIFLLTWAMPGVLSLSDGTDFANLVAGNELVLLALTDGNFDADFDGDGDLTDNAPVTNWTYSQPGSLTNIMAEADGSVIYGVVPEPSSILVWGMLLTGAIVAYRRRRRA